MGSYISNECANWYVDAVTQVRTRGIMSLCRISEAHSAATPRVGMSMLPAVTAGEISAAVRACTITCFYHIAHSTPKQLLNVILNFVTCGSLATVYPKAMQTLYQLWLQFIKNCANPTSALAAVHPKAVQRPSHSFPICT